MDLNGGRLRRWLILSICVGLGFGVGFLQRRINDLAWGEREAEIRTRLAGPRRFLSDAESRTLTEELRAIDRRTLASDLASGARTAALVIVIWYLALAKPLRGEGLAAAVGALAGSAQVAHGGAADGLALFLGVLANAAGGAGVGVVIWLVAQSEIERGINGAGP